MLSDISIDRSNHLARQPKFIIPAIEVTINPVHGLLWPKSACACVTHDAQNELQAAINQSWALIPVPPVKCGYKVQNIYCRNSFIYHL